MIYSCGSSLRRSWFTRRVENGHLCPLNRQAATLNCSCSCRQGDTSAFGFSRTRGEIPPAGTEHPGEAHITLNFCPSLPTNYYRRVFCLLENQLPMVMDLMGTGYLVAKGEVEEQRPAPLRHAHVQASRNR